MYRTFTRTWWVKNTNWPNGREPCPGRKHYVGKYQTENEARQAAQEWNRTHEPGEYSRKMEYESS
jgi:hypothetical protein